MTRIFYNKKEDDAYDVDKDKDEDEDDDADEDEDKDDEEDGEEDDEEDEDEDDDEDDVDYQDVPCDNDNDNELYNGLLFYDDNDDDLNWLEGGKYHVPSVRGKGGGRQPNPNRPPRPNTDGMSADEAKNALDHWEKDCRSTKDKARRALAHQVSQGEGSLDDSRSFTGVCDLTMRLMTEVKLHPLQIEHTFPTKNITLLRIAEGANLWGVRIILKQSDTHQIRVVGLQDTFHVVAYFSDSRSEWKITKCDIQHSKVNGQPPVQPLTDDDIPHDSAVDDMLHMEVGHADGDVPTPTNTGVRGRPQLPMCGRGKVKVKQPRIRSPLKSKWLIPIVKVEVSQYI